MTQSLLHQGYWWTMGPMMILALTALVVMVLELFVKTKNPSRLLLTNIAMVGTLVALAVQLLHFRSTPILTLNDMVSDGLANIFSVLMLFTAFLVLLFTADYQQNKPLAGEHSYLILFAVIGSLAMVTATDLVTLYVGLELLSVSSYVLIALRTKSLKSVAGGMKYLVMGGIGSAVFLYGLSFIYGVSGTTSLFTIAQNSQTLWSGYGQIAGLGSVLVLAGLGVKLSLVPFHMWTPDAYDGAPSPVSSLLATLAKSATFVMLLRILLYIFNGIASKTFFYVGLLALITMVVGNLLALPEKNMKRLLAFSSVAQAGYMLIPIALFARGVSYDWTGLYSNLAFYLFAYTFMTIGAFAVVSLISRDKQTVQSFGLTGLWNRSPWLTIAFTIFLLGLAGMPLTAGFVGKFYIFLNTVHLHELWLGIVLFATSVMSMYYYFGLIRQMFQSENAPLPSVVQAAGLRVSPYMHVLIALCIAGTVLLGVAPSLLLHPLAIVQW